MHRARSNPQFDPDCRLEAVTLESEISMSVVTEASRAANESRRRQRRFFDRLTGRRERNDTGITDLTEIEDERTGCCANINVEPTLALIALALGIFLNSNPLFTYWARCIELAEKYHGPGANATAICSTLSYANSTEFNDIVEKDIAATRIYIQLAGTVPTLLVAPIIGNWSDHHGRKKPLIFAMCGMILSFLMQLIATITYESISIYDFAFASEVIFAFCGGPSALFSAMLSIVTDEARMSGLRPGSSEVPMKIAIATGIQGLGMMFGPLIVSWLSVPAIESVDDHVGAYVKAALMATLLVIAAFVYSVVFVRETHRPEREFEYDNGEERDYLVDSSLQHPGKGWASRMGEKMKQIVEVLTERRPGYTRFCLNLSLIFVFVEFLVMDANLLFLYLKRQPFSWSDRYFSLLGFFRGLCVFLGMIALPLLMKATNFLGKDSILIGIGVFSGTISYTMIAFAKTNTEIVGATALSFFGGGISPGFRSFLPRMVPKEQTARLLTCISIITAFCPILSSFVFNNVFQWSISFWPGLAFLVGAAFQALVTIGQIVVHCLMRSQWILAERLRGQRLIEDEEDTEERREEERRVLMGHQDDRSVSNEAVGSVSPTGSRGEDAGDTTTMLDERRPVIL